MAGEAEEGVKSISFTEFLNCYITGSFELMQGAKLHESEFWALRIPKIAGMIKGKRGGEDNDIPLWYQFGRSKTHESIDSYTRRIFKHEIK